MDLTGEKQEVAQPTGDSRGVTRDAAVSAVITVAIIVPVWIAVGSVQGGAMWLLIPFAPVLPLLLFGAPFAVAFYGFAALRPGFVLGPTLLVSLACAAALFYMLVSDRAVHAFATQSIEPANRPHSVLMTDGGGGECDADCVRILASSSYLVARKAEVVFKGWRLFRRGEGDACLAEGQRQSASMFVAAGFRGMCALQSNVPDVTDGLLLRVRYLGRSWSEATGAPAGFAGAVYEIVERTDGRDRLLGRRLDGVISLPIPAAVAIFISFSLGLVSEQHVVVGPRIEPQEFLTTASGTPFDKPFGG
jgi:hypothetical protein